MHSLSISIVLYHNRKEELQQVINCVLNSTLEAKLFLIDNSDTDQLKELATDPRIDYVFNNANLGYGAAHNIGIKEAMAQNGRYHLIMNPDIHFEPTILTQLFNYMESHPEVGSLMPKVFHEDGSLQRLCKLLPTPFDLIGRRFLGGTSWAKKQNKKYELHHFDYNSILNTPCLSGCFMFVRTNAFQKSGLFDPRYFMYLEDYDLNRRINQHYKTIFFPEVSIIHGHAKESYKNGRLLKIHIQSAIKYFNKWGWFIDQERTRLNNQVLENIE